MSDEPSWGDPTWLERSDNAWQRALRRHQGWWRETRLGEAAGQRLGGDRPVVSMLTEDAPESANLWSPEARRAADHAVAAMQGRPGKIERRRLHRNLLSSQPLCFNLFGYLREDPAELLPWVQALAPDAVEVMRIELEWATSDTAVGGSAFDAFVEYRRSDEKVAFIGIETKYAENLMASQRKPARDVYVLETRPPTWKSGAAERLDRNGLRQFWYNTLLALRLQKLGGYAEARSVVVALADDVKARAAVAAVARELEDERFHVFSPLETVVTSVEGHPEWKAMFTDRYLNFSASGTTLPTG